MTKSPENSVEKTDREGKLVRFRRWIAMTPDSKWREFRGTADMVNIGQGKDLVEIVDNMMLARISNFEQMVNGWKVMRNGLTASNADWIYSEMMASLESLQTFEQENFSKQNSWTAAKDRRAFPTYLCDRPVLDGDMYKQNEPTQSKDKLRSYFGDFVPKKLLEMLKENQQKCHKQFEGTSEQFLALGNEDETFDGDEVTIEQKPRSNPRVNALNSSHDSSTQTTERTANSRNTVIGQAGNIGASGSLLIPPKPKGLCSGVGVSINENGVSSITVLSNSDRRSSALSRIGPTSVVRNSQIRPLMNMNFKSLSNVQSQLLALLVVQDSTGQRASMGFVPISFPSLTDQNSLVEELVLDRPDEVWNLTSREPQDREENPQQSRNRTISERTQPSISPNSTPTSNQSDSGFGSTSDRGNVSTRTSTPAISTLEIELQEEDKPLNCGRVEEITSGASEDDKEEKQSDAGSDHESVVTVTEELLEPTSTQHSTDDVIEQTVEKHDSPTTSTPVRNQSYASIVSKQTTSSLFSFSDRNTTPIVVSGSSLNVVMADNPLVEEVGQKTQMTSLYDEDVASTSQGFSTECEWILVKNKAAVVPKPAEEAIVFSNNIVPKEQKLSSISEVAECWDNVEVDEERERELERRRLRKQKQRAAKVQRLRNERRAREESLVRTEASSEPVEVVEEVEEIVEEIVEEQSELVNTVTTEIPKNISQENIAQIENLSIENCENEPATETEKIDSNNFVGTQKYCDDDIIKEEEEEEDEDESEELLFLQSKEHAKLMFRLLWFDNKKKLEKLRIDEPTHTRLRALLDMVRAMKDRIDMAGRIIVYRVGRPKITEVMEQNVVMIARNLIDVTRHHLESDIIMAKSMRDLVGKLTKNFTYMNYVFAILTLPEDFLPKFEKGDSRIGAYQEIIVLTQLHIKRVAKIYEELCDLYDFKIVKVPKRHRRRL